ncbi:MAG TPA: hypothetical protein VKH44_09510 [Pirellulaceae bacterium]|nr:hypothetical protein [Pirellulaceae bacterium]
MKRSAMHLSLLLVHFVRGGLMHPTKNHRRANNHRVQRCSSSSSWVR